MSLLLFWMLLWLLMLVLLFWTLVLLFWTLVRLFWMLLLFSRLDPLPSPLLCVLQDVFPFKALPTSSATIPTPSQALTAPSEAHPASSKALTAPPEALIRWLVAKLSFPSLPSLCTNWVLKIQDYGSATVIMTRKRINTAFQLTPFSPRLFSLFLVLRPSSSSSSSSPSLWSLFFFVFLCFHIGSSFSSQSEKFDWIQLLCLSLSGRQVN